MSITVTEASERIFKPTPKQIEFIKVPDTVFEGLFGGAAAAGKSILIVMLPIIRGWFRVRGFQGIIFRRTFPQLEESIIQKAKEYYPRTGARYNAQNHVYTWPDSGATMRFSYLDKDESAQDHDSAEYQYLAFDELTGFTWYMYSYLTHRTRSTLKDVPAIVRSTATPGNIGHTWVRDRFIKPAPAGNVIIAEKEKVKMRGVVQEVTRKRIFVPGKLYDNPHMMQKDPDYANRLSLLPEADRRAKADGDWDVYQGQVFTEFREKKIIGEPDNALHVCEPFKIPWWWPRFLAVDWGYAAKAYANWVALSPDLRLFAYREYSRRKQPIAIWAADIKYASQFDQSLVQPIALDPSAFAERGEPHTIAQQFSQHSELSVTRAFNDRLSGKLLLHEYLRFEQRPPRYKPKEGFQIEVMQRIWRIDGEEKAKAYQAMFEPEKPELNLPKLQIFKGECPSLVEAIQACVYDDRNKEDVKEWDGDDPYDDIRYQLKQTDRYTNEVKKEFIKQEKLGAIVTELEATGNQTAFYRKMEKYDAENRRGSNPIRRGRLPNAARAVSGIRYSH
jgi:hypothetical protein